MDLAMFKSEMCKKAFSRSMKTPDTEMVRVLSLRCMHMFQRRTTLYRNDIQYCAVQ
jgi:hypothetical protein